VRQLGLPNLTNVGELQLTRNYWEGSPQMPKVGFIDMLQVDSNAGLTTLSFGPTAWNASSSVIVSGNVDLIALRLDYALTLDSLTIDDNPDLDTVAFNFLQGARTIEVFDNPEMQYFEHQPGLGYVHDSFRFEALPRLPVCGIVEMLLGLDAAPSVNVVVAGLDDADGDQCFGDSTPATQGLPADLPDFVPATPDAATALPLQVTENKCTGGLQYVSLHYELAPESLPSGAVFHPDDYALRLTGPGGLDWDLGRASVQGYAWVNFVGTPGITGFGAWTLEVGDRRRGGPLAEVQGWELELLCRPPPLAKCSFDIAGTRVLVTDTDSFSGNFSLSVDPASALTPGSELTLGLAFESLGAGSSFVWTRSFADGWKLTDSDLRFSAFISEAVSAFSPVPSGVYTVTAFALSDASGGSSAFKIQCSTDEQTLLFVTPGPPPGSTP